MRDGAAEPAVPPGTCWPGMSGHGAVTSPATTIPVLRWGVKRPPRKPAQRCGARAPWGTASSSPATCPVRSQRVFPWESPGTRREKLLPARAGHPALSGEPTAGIAPRLASPYDWHRPVAFLGATGPACTPYTVSGCRGWRGSGPATRSQRLIPNKASPIPHARPGRECAEAALGGTVLASDLRGVPGRSEVMGWGVPPGTRPGTRPGTAAGLYGSAHEIPKPDPVEIGWGAQRGDPLRPVTPVKPKCPWGVRGRGAEVLPGTGPGERPVS